MKVYNHDIAGIIRRARRFRYEINKAVSANLAAVSVSDFTRAESYLAALNQYIDWVEAQPILDLPESAPREIDLGEADPLTFPENEAVADLMNLYELLEVEMGNSQSARQASNLISHDLLRLRSLLTKMQNFLQSYVSNVLPLDLPEASPKQPMTGAGRTGV